MTTKYFEIPFANSGDQTTIPDLSQPSGNVSFADGWTPDYEKDQETDPDAKDVSRQGQNYLNFTITEAMKEIQDRGGKPYDPIINYSVGAIIIGSDDNLYRCLIKNGPGASFLPDVDPVGDTTGTWIIHELIYTSMSSLRASLLIPVNTQIVTVIGGVTPGDGLGGLFYWDSASTDAENAYNTVIKLTAIVTGRFLRLNPPALILSGQHGDPVRPKGQMIFKSDESDSTSHAILTGHILNADDEGALEFQVKFSDASTKQISADFARTIDDGSGAGDKPTARVVRATHVVSTVKGDHTPLALWDGNSVGVCLGSTSGEPFNQPPIADSMFFVGLVNEAQFQVLPIQDPTKITLQAYDVGGAAFFPLSINASVFEFGVGPLLPAITSTLDIGSTTKKFKRIWTDDIQTDTIGLSGVATISTGSGSPEGVVDASTGSMYTNTAGGAGTTFYVKESSPTVNTGWVGK